jgi:acyl carrier protein
MKTGTEILQLLKEEISSETGIPASEIADSASFFELGLNSISAVFILDVLEKKLKVEMNPLFFWDYPTVELLADYITTLIKK